MQLKLDCGIKSYDFLIQMTNVLTRY